MGGLYEILAKGKEKMKQETKDFLKEAYSWAFIGTPLIILVRILGVLK